MAEIFVKELSARELGVWTAVLQDRSDAAVEWSCSNWIRNGKFFPKPSEILELIQAFRNLPENQPRQCDIECQKRHGKGYHTNDVNWLFKRYLAALKTDPKVKITDLMDELDSKRQGGPPEWRKVGMPAAKPYVGEPIRDEDIPF